MSYELAGRFSLPRRARMVVRRATPRPVLRLARAHYRVAPRHRAAQLEGLGFSLKPPKFVRKAARAVGRTVRQGAALTASTFIPGAGLVIGSKKAPRWLRADKSVRKLVRTEAKVQLAAAAVAAAVIAAPVVLPAIASSGGALLTAGTAAAKWLMAQKAAGKTPGTGPDASPGYSSGGDGGGYSSDSGGGAPASMDTPNEVEPGPETPAAAGGGGLAIALAGAALLFMSQRKAG